MSFGNAIKLLILNQTTSIDKMSHQSLLEFTTHFEQRNETMLHCHNWFGMLHSSLVDTFSYSYNSLVDLTKPFLRRKHCNQVYPYCVLTFATCKSNEKLPIAALGFNNSIHVVFVWFQTVLIFRCRHHVLFEIRLRSGIGQLYLEKKVNRT